MWASCGSYCFILSLLISTVNDFDMFFGLLIKREFIHRVKIGAHSEFVIEQNRFNIQRIALVCNSDKFRNLREGEAVKQRRDVFSNRKPRKIPTLFIIYV